MDAANFSQQLSESDFYVQNAKHNVGKCLPFYRRTDGPATCQKSPDSFKNISFVQLTDSFREDWYQVSVYRTVGPLVSLLGLILLQIKPCYILI